MCTCGRLVEKQRPSYTSFVPYLKVFNNNLYLSLNIHSFRSTIEGTENSIKTVLNLVSFLGVGAFEQLFGPGRGGFKQKFSKNSNARGVARGGMLKLRID